MKRSHLIYSILVAVFFILIVISRLPVQTTNAAPDPTLDLQEAWEKARQSGRYHYRSFIEQTIYPAPSVQNAGRSPQEDHLGVEGQVDLTAETMTMTLWEDGSFNPQTGIEVKVEDGQTFGRRGQGDWQQLNNFAESFAPGGDPLGFLAGAVNVQAAGTEQRDFEGASLTYSRYIFEMDGVALAAHLIEQTDQYEEKYGPLPAGMQLETPEHYRRLSGQGEIWLNEAGLPAHLSLTMDMPDQPKAGERATVLITTAYSRFDMSQLALAATPLFRDPLGWIAFRLPETQTAVQEQLPGLQLLVLFGLVLALCLRHWRRRRFYGAVISLIIVSMLTSPLLQGLYAEAYMGRVSADQQDQQAQQQEVEQQQQIQKDVQALNNDWNPHQNPLTVGQEQAAVQAAVQKNQLSALQATGQQDLSLLPTAVA